MSYLRRSRDQHFSDPGAKRILALDGGGLRGIVSLGILRRVEAVLRAQHGDDDRFRLCHYFDLIAGTSTGAIIAAALALGMTVDEVIGHYQRLGREVFTPDWFRQGILRSRYNEAALVEHLKRVFGAELTLGDEALQTGLLVVTKRLDTGSPWPLGNNPQGRFFKASAGESWISNGDYPLWQVVRASTAAPTYFDPEQIVIASDAGKRPVVGTFVDGGVSPFNNPALQAFMYTTLCGYRVNWKTGPDALQLVSVGTGMVDPRQAPSRIAAQGAVRALFSLMDDCASLVETTLQWLSDSPTARVIDLEVADCKDDELGGGPQLSYARYNTWLTADALRPLLPDVEPERLASLGAMDDPEQLDILLAVGEAVGAQQVKDAHFAPAFALPRAAESAVSIGADAGPRVAAAPTGGRRRYVKRADQAVTAVQLALEGAGFTYEKWGGRQTCKAGDWLVNNNGDVYTVDADSFARTYRQVDEGKYVKATPVWAEVAATGGRVHTKEGTTAYQPGDYLVFNDESAGDGYAVSARAFEEMYQLA